MRNSNRIIEINNKNYTIPTKYEEILKNLLIITGVGRSGTTILGKVMGSMREIHYLFEPAIMRLVSFLVEADKANKQVYSLLIRSILLDDYFLQLIHGRSLNFNEKDDSYIGNYVPKSDIEKRWDSYRRRQDVIASLDEKKPLFVIKIPEFQPLFSAAMEIFSKPYFIHIIRNGNDVVSSSVGRGWFSDKYMNEDIIDWVNVSGDEVCCNLPWYIDKQSKEWFPKWNQITRAACVWRTLTERGMAFCTDNPKTTIQLQYEDFVKEPETFVRQFEEELRLKSTEITKRHVDSIKGRNLSQYSSIYDDIEKPEREKFASLMERLGYRV